MIILEISVWNMNQEQQISDRFFVVKYFFRAKYLFAAQITDHTNVIAATKLSNTNITSWNTRDFTVERSPTSVRNV